MIKKSECRFTWRKRLKEIQAFAFHRVANATRENLAYLIPALKGRAKLRSTLRVALKPTYPLS